MKKFNLNFKVNLKIVIFSISTLVFLYLLYLSIPSLYDTGRVQKVLSKEISSDFDLNLSLSSDISYRILPKPHFVIRDAKLFNIKSQVNNEIGQIKELKVYIKQNKLFDKNIIKISKINIHKANFFLKKDDLSYAQKYFNKIFINKDIKILNSKIFYNDRKNNTVFIYSIKKSIIKLLKSEDKNSIISEGEIFKIPTRITWEKDFENDSKILKINLKKIFFDLENKSVVKDNKYSHETIINILNSKLKFSSELFKNHIEFYSTNSIIKNTPVTYKGKIDLKPFFLETKIKAKQFDLNYFLKKSFWLDEIISSNFFKNENFNGRFYISSDKVLKSKIFDNINVVLNFDEGNLNLDGTVISGEKIGSLKIFNSNFVKRDGKIFFESKVKLNVERFDLFYKKFLVSKKNRKKFKHIDFSFIFDTLNGSFYVNRIIFYDLNGKRVNSEKVDEVVDNNIDKKFNYFNINSFRNFLNEILIVHSELG